MYDISCLYGKPEFSTIQKDAYNDWDSYWSFNPFEAEFTKLLKDYYSITADGAYYFVQQNGVLVPVWDLTSNGPYAGNPNAIVYAQKYKNVPSSDGPANIDWVELKKVSGGLANVIYRVDTVKGQPPSTVSPPLNPCLFCSINFFCSAPLAAVYMSNTLQITVRVHDLIIAAWPLLINPRIRISSVCLKAVGAKRPLRNTFAPSTFDFSLLIACCWPKDSSSSSSILPFRSEYPVLIPLAPLTYRRFEFTSH